MCFVGCFIIIVVISKQLEEYQYEIQNKTQENTELKEKYFTLKKHENLTRTKERDESIKKV
jgi:hypothetical protein